MSAYFVTSSGTGIGKTLVTAALIHQTRRQGREVRALKPVISGFAPETAAESDSGRLLVALGQDVAEAAVAAISPWRFAAPLSPDMAAAREATAIDFDLLVAFCRAAADQARRSDATLLIEGVGGALAPLTERHTVADWMAALRFPAVVVVGSYLGTLSHTLTAVEALARRDIPIASVVVSESEHSPVAPAETVASLERFLPRIAPGIVVVSLPRLADGPRAWEAAPDLSACLG